MPTFIPIVMEVSKRGELPQDVLNDHKQLRPEKLPPTVSELLSPGPFSSNTKLNTFFCSTKRFDNVTLNRILTLWLFQNSLPWSYVEDKALHLAFHYAQPSSHIFMRKWQAQSAQSLYLDLQKSMISRLQNPETAHIRCFCHKLALVVDAGLKELGIKAPHRPKVRESMLGHFPLTNTLETIPKEDEYENTAGEASTDNCDHEDRDSQEGDGDLEDQDVDDEIEDNNPFLKRPTNFQKSNDLNELTTSLDFVIQKITGSAPWRQKFKAIALGKGLKLLDLIAGYGIQWNIKYESRRRAYEAREERKIPAE
ncbi:hypothetical protein PCASD_12484 [Puccinia coronata f. sp. avenae]|uniref:HAT C-terminal dimerisation domain-containing protein n=1 Tax=Puccinia coronata f. sp. avenae TaxID=200324 RepID=A0A2N5U5C9_9BASI|nr:hypothetical protein PCASD_12484 [Puccinia coronata f. sp. avenae]